MSTLRLNGDAVTLNGVDVTLNGADAGGTLAFNNIVIGSPVVTSLTFYQNHQLTFTAVTSTPVVSNKILLQGHALGLTNLSINTPSVNDLSLLQKHQLSLAGLVINSPTVGTLDVLIGSLGLSALTSTPIIESLSITQQIVFGFSNLVISNPVVANLLVSSFLSGAYNPIRAVSVPQEIRVVLIDKVRVPDKTTLVSNEVRSAKV